MYRLYNIVFDLLSPLLTDEGSQSPNEFNAAEVPGPYYEKEEKMITGKITYLFENYGLVDGYIYFNRQSVKTDDTPEVDDTAVVSATREVRHTGWRATSVQILNDEWDTVQRVYQLHGNITNLSRDGVGVVNYKHQFLAKCCKDYEPWRGDKVLLEMVDNGSTEVVESVQPFSVQEYQGRVVHVGQLYCFIDSDIAFTRQCCCGCYTPCKGDLVTGTMVECDQGQRWTYRALTVNPHDITDSRGEGSIGDTDATPSRTGNVNSNKSAINRDYIFIDGRLVFDNTPVGESQSSTIFVRNGTKDTLKLTSLAIREPVGSQFTLSKPKICLEGLSATCTVVSSSELSLWPGMTFYFILTFHPRYVGEDQQELQISFDGLTETRKITGTSVPGGQDECRDGGRDSSRQTYRQVRHNIQLAEENQSVLPGVRPTFKQTRLPKNLPHYEVPGKLRQCVLEDTRQLQRRYPQLEQELSTHNFTSRFSLLLHLEEISAEIEIRRFDIAEGVFSRSRGYLTLVVPGLPDGQPSLMVGDKLSVTVNHHMQPISYEGYIHDIIFDTIYVKFHSSFHDRYQEEECYVRFYISRVPFRRMHHAVKLSSQMGWPGLSPRQISIRSVHGSADSLDVKDDDWLLNKILNLEQRLAVKRVLQAKCRPYPYVIFGPPGTGKTVTMVESALQVFTKVRGSRILFCTPSNSAADLVTVQLCKSYQWPVNSLVRLISYSRQVESLPEAIQSFCRDGTDLSLVAEHRVIVSTCVSAGMFLSLGVSTKHFTHVYVDEAGQASEPECLIPISLVAANSEASVILAGDHKQLGAVVKSRIAEDRGLSISLLERIMQHPPYDRHEDQFKHLSSHDPNLVTKLLKNYRAHPFILSPYSELFYDSELVVAAGEEAFSLQDIEELICKGKPIIFHGLQGEELREGGNPSWFNAVEVVQVVKYLKTALKYCQPCDIGVITPYRKQVEKIRQLMTCIGVTNDVKVGSVEEFQGQERRIIVVSTVRSRADSVDALGNSSSLALGFLKNCKRFNVTISRAQALLIVVGNPLVLAQDEHWKFLIDYCTSNDCYVGVPYNATSTTVTDNVVQATPTKTS